MNENVTKALAVIDREEQKGALSFVTREDFMGVTPLYKPEVTVIQLRLPQKQWDNDADVYEISGKYMPKREIVDRIGEATGLVFLRDGCRTWSELREDDIAGKRTVYVSEQQAKKRMSDGSFRTSSVNVAPRNGRLQRNRAERTDKDAEKQNRKDACTDNLGIHQSCPPEGRDRRKTPRNPRAYEHADGIQQGRCG